MFCLIKKYFCFSHHFQTSLHNTDHLLYYPHMSTMFSFHTFVILLCQFTGKGT